MLMSEDETKTELELDEDDEGKMDGKTLADLDSKEITEANLGRVNELIINTVNKAVKTYPLLQDIRDMGFTKVIGAKTIYHWLTGFAHFDRLAFSKIIKTINRTLVSVGLQKIFITLVCVAKVRTTTITERKTVITMKKGKPVKEVIPVKVKIQEASEFECPFCSTEYIKGGQVAKRSKAITHEVNTGWEHIQQQQKASNPNGRNRGNLEHIRCHKMHEGIDSLIFLEQPDDEHVLNHYRALLVKLKEDFADKPFLIIPTSGDYPIAIVFDIPHIKTPRLELYKEVLPHVKDKNLAALIASHA